MITDKLITDKLTSSIVSDRRAKPDDLSNRSRSLPQRPDRQNLDGRGKIRGLAKPHLLQPGKQQVKHFFIHATFANLNGKIISLQIQRLAHRPDPPAQQPQDSGRELQPLGHFLPQADGDDQEGDGRAVRR